MFGDRGAERTVKKSERLRELSWRVVSKAMLQSVN